MQRKCNDATEMTQTYILRGKADFWGRQTLYIRWSNKQQRRLQKTTLLLTPDQLKSFQQGIPGKDKDLYRKFLSIMEEPETIKTDFYKYCEARMKEEAREFSPETIRQQKGEISKLKAFRPVVNLQDITPAFLSDYKAHCYELGNVTNTVWKSFKYLRKIVLRAYKEKLIPDYPFAIFEMPRYRNPQKKYLTEDQIEALLAIEDLPEQIRIARDWFVIGCYTGLRFGDMASFNKKEKIRNGRLVLYTKKTGEVVSLPFTDKLKELFERVNYLPVEFSNGYFNILLKQLDVGLKLSVHVARHSFGTLCASKGMRQEVIAKYMGHSSIKTTAIYAQLSSPSMDDEYRKLG